ncbi:signal recognition particle protein [Thermovirga sp.]|uniref:signal recognition particle protein n=1 Tax=Thermovirga sp. TaxID=2699834 RepID=UPI0025CBDA87|nr:signal recognition particle protein [Thermovirga sp.]MBO8153928.1 signal recognition particle protein [Thermovirga sp.]
MLDTLKKRFEKALGLLRNKGKLSEQDIAEAVREVRRALLEGDVSLKVAKELAEKIKERATQREVLDSITPAQQIQAIVYEELVNLMGGKTSKGISFASKPPTICMMVGLQGAGKTTTCVKIAKKLKGSHKPLVVACDLKRPAAVEQLEILANSAGVGFFGPQKGDADLKKLVGDAIDYATSRLYDVLILDTAGRLHVNEELMQELVDIKEMTNPTEVLLVLDAMTGQEAIRVAEAFHGDLDLTGLILTKMDGDARGGALLSAKAVADVPVKYIGVGEKLDDIEIFDPEQMAQRILGMGDLKGLAEKVKQVSDFMDVEKVTKNIAKGKLTMEDLLQQIRQIKRMGPLEKIVEMLPGGGKIKELAGAQMDDSKLKHIEAIILSMTPEERKNPKIIKGSRRRRIAYGSGTSVQMVNQVLSYHKNMNEIFKQFKGRKGRGFRLPRGLPFK